MKSMLPLKNNFRSAVSMLAAVFAAGLLLTRPGTAAEMPASTAEGQIAAKPLFRDPVYDGAADPTLIWNRLEKKWFMFYTNRRANLTNAPSGFAWVHATPIGIAESSDHGATWSYRCTAQISYGENDSTFWAPEVLYDKGLYHMFVTLVPGIFNNWNHPRDIIHLTSTNLLQWTYVSTLKLSSDRVIDPCLLRLPDGSWRMWYNNERDHKSIYYADSPDLYEWKDGSKAIADQPGEGPNVFHWKGHYWMVVDNWKGLGVYRSDDLLHWTRQARTLVQEPGHGPDDMVSGNHPDVIVSGERAFLFYFTHPGRQGPDARKDTYEQRRSSIQVTELELQGEEITSDRDKPTHIYLAAQDLSISSRNPSSAAMSPPRPANSLPTLFIIGDSTVNNPMKGLLGWGTPIADLFDKSKINIENRARGGRSSRSYYTEGLWDQVAGQLRPGDFVLMQFGHNDGGPLDTGRARASLKGNSEETREIENSTTGKKETVHTYGWYLRKYITDSRDKGATPIVLSLVPRNIWKDGKVLRATNDYGKWAAEAAATESGLYVDLNGVIANQYDQQGQEKVASTYFTPADHTHTTPAGARLNAACVVEGIKQLDTCALRSFLAPPKKTLSDWPPGATPQEIGKRVAENFAARQFDFQTNPKRQYVIYPEACAWYGSLEVAQLLGDQDLQKRLAKKFELLVAPDGPGRISPVAHVDYRVFGIVPLEIYMQNGDKKCLEAGQQLADQQWEQTTPDGITSEARYWVDDMFMITAVQTQAFRATKNPKYLEHAAVAMTAYLQRLQQTNGLFYHAPDVPFFWGRGNGWVAAGMSELLRSLPEDNANRAFILEGYRKMMAALLKYQSADGLWRQLIDHPESWPETSSTGMFTFAMITGVENGWLDEAIYGAAARKGWLGLVSYLNPNGDIREVCEGTNKKNDIDYYLARARKVGDLHGQAPVLWCAAALMRGN